MKWICRGLAAMTFGFFSLFTHGCVTPGEVKIANSLPEIQLAYYHDSFEQLRDDLWDRAGYVRYETQLENIKLADMDIDDGKLVIKTKTGGYSKGGLGSRFSLRGDFDIQIDCQVVFFQETFDMDQVVSFVVLDRAAQIEQMNLVTIGLIKRGIDPKSGVYMGCRKLGRYERVNAKAMKAFLGSFRIMRSGSEVKGLYRKEGDTWHELGTVSFNANDVMVGFVASNFVAVRWSITASKSMTATFDNFRINAAQGIIEEEI